MSTYPFGTRFELDRQRPLANLDGHGAVAADADAERVRAASRCAEHDHRRSEVLLGLGYEQVGFVEEAKFARFRRDLVRGYPVQMHHDVVGLVTETGHAIKAPRGDDFLYDIKGIERAQGGVRDSRAVRYESADLASLKPTPLAAVRTLPSFGPKRKSGSGLQGLPGSWVSVKRAPCAAPDPDSPPPRPRRTNAIPAATAAPAIGPAT
jgi:hypothetical protein